jgi:type IV pilus assembly protein PilV
MPKHQVVKIMHTSPSPTHQRGSTLIEVLVSMVILTFGMLGLAGMQAKLQQSELEAYQRSQALLLLNDMASRITANRTASASYVTASPLGTGVAACTLVAGTRQELDSCDWQNALLGASETSGTTKLGAMVGARGCVQSLGTNLYMVTVAWQGMGPISAPPASVTCGANSYDGASGSSCVNDLCRRVLTTIVRIALLT